MGHDLVGSGWGVDNGMWRSIIETLGLGARASTWIVNNDKISLGQVIHMEIYLPLPKADTQIITATSNGQGHFPTRKLDHNLFC